MSMRHQPCCPVVASIPSPIVKNLVDLRIAAFASSLFVVLPFGVAGNGQRIYMRSVCTSLLVAAVCLVSNPASSVTSGELLRSCAEIVKKGHFRANAELDIPPTGLLCWYYMSAIQNMSVLENLDGVRLLGICSLPDTTLMDYVQILVQKAPRKSELKTRRRSP